MSELSLVPISISDAWRFVERHHRHHRAHKYASFAVAAARGMAIVGVAVIGHPSARMLNDGFTAEVTRLCSIDVGDNGHASGCCSMLYAASWRAARALGFRRLVTYTLPDEGGASLRGAGWTLVGTAGGGSWSRATRPRVDRHPTQEKLRWERLA